jgi:hypothetical protein
VSKKYITSRYENTNRKGLFKKNRRRIQMGSTIKVVNTGSTGNGFLLCSNNQTLIVELGMKMMDYTLNMEDFASVRGCIASHW